ncbi:hypothetical protein [Undibacterium sp. Xuan67W]|uniref:hypothetical protein n=1 Tax=Undibacterium sp. Xuan67W TaxID=3413057 RepID=UPI003BEFC6FE
MKPLFDKKHFIQLLRGYTIYDCAINNKDRYCFLLVEEADNRDTLPRTRFVIVLADNPMEERFGWYETGDLTFTTFVRGINPPEYVGVDTRSNVYSSNAQRKGEEKSIDQVIDMRTHQGGAGIVRKVVRAAGQVYALGNYRKIYRRIGMEQWIELGQEGKGVPVPADIETGKSYSQGLGFRDMSAFSADDMYAVGGDGDVWRFDGNKWHNCPIPTNADLRTVCCAGDGQVYITEMNGSVWAGRADKWKRIVVADIAPGYQPVDAVWFNQRLYLGGQEGLWTIDIKNKSLVPLDEVESDAPNATNGGRLDLSPDGKYLLTAGPHGACLNDGTGWKRLFSTFDFL